MKDNKDLATHMLSDDDLDNVVGGMGVENRFEDLPGGMCKCLSCGKIIKISEASLHDAQCQFQ